MNEQVKPRSSNQNPSRQPVAKSGPGYTLRGISPGEANSMAAQSDKFALYEESVQASDAEVDFLQQCFGQFFKRKPIVLREDFCGSGWLCAEWVKSNPKRRAIGVDLHQGVLEWGTRQHLGKLTKSQKNRVSLIHENVLSVETEKADIITALNFSYWTFKSRAFLRAYFQRAFNALNSDSMLVLDIFSGPDASSIKTEKRTYKNFTYVWEQESYNPINADFVCNIHFEFKDGSAIRKAFEYHWRLWTPHELREILFDVGFNEVTIFLRESDDKGWLTGNTEEIHSLEDPDLVWLAYIVATRT
jgi:hypothetical protein